MSTRMKLFGLLVVIFVTAGIAFADGTQKTAATSIRFFSISFHCPKLPGKAALRDILFYNGTTQEVMDTRACVQYPRKRSLVNILDGNPRTVLNHQTGDQFGESIRVPLGKTVTHLIVNTPTPQLIAGTKLEFFDQKLRSILTVDLGILRHAAPAPCWRIDLPSLKVTALPQLPQGTFYQFPEIRQFFTADARHFDFRQKEIPAIPSWNHTPEGIYPYFAGVSSPNASNQTKSEDIFKSVDGDPHTKWCVSFKPGLIWQVQLKQPAVIRQYAFTSANDCPKRDPKSWRLEGSNDGIHWVLLDEKKNLPMFPKRFQTRTYSFDNDKA
ncbi:MAG: discoidin domain-containing protein, partial [Lentisphaerae bacterium]